MCLCVASHFRLCKVTRYMLFYSIGLPIVEVLNAYGIPALLRFVDKERM